MKVEFLRTARHSYMIVKDVDYTFEKYEVQMILYNEPSCLLPMQIIMGDGKVEYWYDVAGMQSLEREFLTVQMDFEKLRALFQDLCKMKKQMEDYMLDDCNIDFSAEQVYFDRTREIWRFCYIPGYEKAQGTGIQGLLERVLQLIDHTDTRAVRLGYRMYECCSRNGFLVEECLRCMREEQRETENSADEAEPRNTLLQEQTGEEDSVLQEEKRIFKRGRKREKRTRSFSYRHILEEEKEEHFVAEKQASWNPTVYFCEQQAERSWELSYQGSGLEQTLRPDKFPYLIGKDKTRVDGVLCADTVSRVHARILEEGGQLYVEDYNSTNGTYLNGRLLPMNTPTLMEKGDRIVFATEEYVLVDRGISK